MLWVNLYNSRISPPAPKIRSSVYAQPLRSVLGYLSLFDLREAVRGIESTFEKSSVFANFRESFRRVSNSQHKIATLNFLGGGSV